MVFTSSGNSGGSDSSKQNVIQELLGSTAGQVVLFAIAAILVGRAGFQFYQAWSGKFGKRLKTIQIDHKYKSLIEYTGVFGYASRGVVILIIAYMFFKAVLTHDPSKAKGMSESFQLIQGNFGPLVLAIISGGLCAYGVFMLIKSYFSYLPELE